MIVIIQWLMLFFHYIANDEVSLKLFGYANDFNFNFKYLVIIKGII